MKRSFLLNILLSLSVSAQSLSLDQAIDRALAYHPDIKVFELKRAQSLEGVSLSRSDYLPQVVLNAEYDPLKTYVLPQNGSFHTKDDQGWHAGVIVKQKIWDFEKTFKAIDAAKVQEDVDRAVLKDVKADLALKVKMQYALMVVQRQAITVRQKDLQSKQELYDQALALVKLGMKTEADATRFLSSLYISRNNLSISKANYEKARQTLELYIGIPIDQDVELDETILYQDLAHKTLFKEIEKNNPQLQASAKRVEKAQLLYESIHASHYGSVDALASYDYQNTLNEYDAKMIGITATIPLYLGGRISASHSRHRLRLRNFNPDIFPRNFHFRHSLNRCELTWTVIRVPLLQKRHSSKHLKRHKKYSMPVTKRGLQPISRY